jgi:hypothetical protein
MSGDALLASRLPQEFLDSIQKKHMIKLNKEYVYHLKTESLAGLSQEWGIPAIFCTFKLHYHNAILRRANQAIALDYLVPIRFFFPQPGASDPGQMLNVRKHKESVMQAMKEHRHDPGDAYYLPFPVGYQAIGGEMKALNVEAEIKMTNEEIMNAMGFPQEFFYGSITVQAAPVALRMMENTLSSWISGMNGLTQWICNKITDYFDLDATKVNWAKVTLVDDIEKKNLLMQLVGVSKIADETLLGAIGTSFSEELKKKNRQQRLELEEQNKLVEETRALQQQAEAESGQGTTPDDVKGKAEQAAQQWLQMDDKQRKQSMEQMSKEDETVYALAKEIMQRLRRQEQPNQG